MKFLKEPLLDSAGSFPETKRDIEGRRREFTIRSQINPIVLKSEFSFSILIANHIHHGSPQPQQLALGQQGCF